MSKRLLLLLAGPLAAVAARRRVLDGGVWSYSDTGAGRGTQRIAHRSGPGHQPRPVRPPQLPKHVDPQSKGEPPPATCGAGGGLLVDRPCRGRSSVVRQKSDLPPVVEIEFGQEP